MSIINIIHEGCKRGEKQKQKMDIVIVVPFAILSLVLTPIHAHGMMQSNLPKGSSLSVEKPKDILTSPNLVFVAGFYQVGENAFCFAIWFENSVEKTVVWMANRDQPVNGKGSKLELTKDGNLDLIDAGRSTLWSSNTIGSSGSFLQLSDSGNLVLTSSSNDIVWQSFHFPTNTLLAHQFLTKDISLISFKSQANYSTGFYKLYFDNDNVLRLIYDDGEISGEYWPNMGLLSWEAGRTTFNDSRVASFDSYGYFESSDDLQFQASDFGIGPLRRLTLDYDGNLKMYSLKENGHWIVTWQAFIMTCNVNGLCGPNALCKYVPKFGRKCTCLPGFKLKDHTNWMHGGCEPEFKVPLNGSQVDFIGFSHVEFYGYDFIHGLNYTFESCRDYCLQSQDCRAFLLKYARGMFNCYPKARLLNGYQSPSFHGTLYLKVPKDITISTVIESSDDASEGSKLSCRSNVTMVLQRNYTRDNGSGPLKFLLWFGGAVGIVEIACIFLVWCFLLRAQRSQSRSTEEMQGYSTIIGFKRFTYDELRNATRNFKHEIGRGGYGIVYKGKLANGRTAAIKKLKEASQGEAEFLAEVSTIGRLNHMNLIEMWGYCIEGNERLLVFEYMENKSLAEKLSSNSLEWETRYEIALGTARGLAYLHDECMEWILHCDVKPQNILLDAYYQPKVADFGLSKLLSRSGTKNSSFSRIRGTRGYMAPEWITNLPITSKVDVYSYGVVVLEMVTGESPFMSDVVTWVREKKDEVSTSESWTEEIADPRMEGNYNFGKMQTLILVALQCVREDKDARPTMRQVVEILQGDHYEEHSICII